MVLLGALGGGAWIVRYFVNHPDQAATGPLPFPQDVPAAPRGGRMPHSFSGRVTDAQSHQPVASFTARVGFAYDEKGPPDYVDGNACTDGRYSIPNDLEEIGDNPGTIWFVRVEAHGFQPGVKSVPAGTTKVDFELLPGQDLTGRVIGPAGAPIGGATVAVALGDDLIIIENGRVQQSDSQVATDSDGKFALPPQGDQYKLVAVADAGFAQVDQEAIVNGADIQLKPWSKIIGLAMSGAKPRATQTIQAKPLVPGKPQVEPQIEFQGKVQSDADGSFAFDRLVPGSYAVGRGIKQHFGRNVVSVFAPVGAAEVTSGQTATLNLGGVGRPVVGKLRLPPEISGGVYFIKASVTDHSSAAPPMIARQYAVEFLATDNFRIDDVIPGNYTLELKVDVPRGMGQSLAPARVDFTMPDVPGGVNDEPLVLPDITLAAN
jgi:hypothetical protein